MSACQSGPIAFFTPHTALTATPLVCQQESTACTQEGAQSQRRPHPTRWPSRVDNLCEQQRVICKADQWYTHIVRFRSANRASSPVRTHEVQCTREDSRGRAPGNIVRLPEVAHNPTKVRVDIDGRIGRIKLLGRCSEPARKRSASLARSSTTTLWSSSAYARMMTDLEARHRDRRDGGVTLDRTRPRSPVPKHTIGWCTMDRSTANDNNACVCVCVQRVLEQARG